MTEFAEGPWLLFRAAPLSAALNMAWDEALLEAVESIGLPILRLYAWTEPAASFGYFQRYKDVERLTNLRPLVRRPTGGGLVPHDHDWTYALLVPKVHPWYRVPAPITYGRLHQWLQAAFHLLNVETTLACTDVEGGGRCFVGASQHDLLFCGRKMAGAALRRTRSGLLVQGSVQPPLEAPPRPDWESAMQTVASRHMKVNWADFVPGPEVADRARQLAEQKYALASYNQGR